MSDQGPVCHVPPANLPGNPQSHNLPGLGSVQPNIPSLVRAVQDLQRAVRVLAGQVNPIVPGATSNGFKSKQDKPTDQGRWIEQDRVTETVRVFNPQDHDQYVDVQQINKLTMRDPITKETWVWDRNRK